MDTWGSKDLDLGSGARREVYLADYAALPYEEALNLQRRVVAEKIEAPFPDTLLLLEHPPVITLGRRGRGENIRVSDELLRREKIDVFHVERGGDVTYHGPGQIVGYPIFALANYGKDLPGFVSSIEEVLIRVCRDMGITAGRRSINRGVWVGEKKIASIGLAVRRWISFHGFALNWAPDMEHFRFITPCGLTGVEMTSMVEVLGTTVNPGRLREAICHHFEEIFRIRFQAVNLAEKLTEGGGHERSQRSEIHQGA
jgi:lipoate-protein ligase B